MRKWRQWNIEWESVLFKHKLRVKRVSEVSGIYGICKVYQREKFRCLNFQVTGVKLFCGGTTLHFIALSYKDRAVISWKPSSLCRLPKVSKTKQSRNLCLLIDENETDKISGCRSCNIFLMATTCSGSTGPFGTDPPEKGAIRSLNWKNYRHS